MSSITACDAALKAQKKGWFLLPITEGAKTPDLNLMQHWSTESTNDAVTIASWFEKNKNRPYAVDLAKSGLTVFDFDEGDVPPNTGMPDTLEISTGRGKHVYTRGVMPQGKLWVAGRMLGDIKSAGGYVLGPYSPHPSGKIYQVSKSKDVAELDGDWAATNLTQQNRTPVNLSLDGPKIPRGSHDNELHRMAGLLRHQGFGQAAIEQILMSEAAEKLENPGDDWQEMVKKHAREICKKPIGTQATAYVGSSSARTATEDWGEVKELYKLPPVALFDPEFLPDALRPWAVDVSERMSVPMDFVGICAIETMAGVIGRRAFVYPKAFDKDWSESIALSGAVVADSGAMKTPTWKALINPIFDLSKDWEATQKAEKEKYEKALKEWEHLDKASKKVEEKGKPAIDVPPAPDEPKTARRLIMNDATPEVAHDIMKNNPAGVFYYRDEIAGWMDELDKEGREAQRTMFLSAMNGDDDCTVDRISREAGTATMCLSVFGGIQPERFRKFLSETKNIDDGTVPRFALLVWPDEPDLPTVDRIANDGLKQQYRRIIRIAAEMVEKQVSFNFNPEAQEVFNSWHEELKKKVKQESNPGKRSHLSKYKGVLAKVAGLFQLVDILATEGPMMGCRTIDAVHLKRAIRFLAYLETHMHRVYDSAQNVIERAEAQIAEHIQDGSLRSGFTMRVIQRKRWYALTKVDYIDLALESLEEKNWIRRIETKPGPEGGRPTVYWNINPAIPQWKSEREYIKASQQEAIAA
jgi:Protein of unknown function (DUF3987)/Bifunctional DNA primase/polymerase, N-terminal